MNKIARTLVLHIGWPKTGTTSLQDFFSVNREPMLNSAGILYPRTGVMGFGHQALSLSLSTKSGETSPLWQELVAELEAQKKWRQVLISCEGLVSAEPARAGRFLAVLPRFDRVRLLAYVRQPDEIRESLFGQAIKDGKWRGSFGEYLEKADAKGDFDYLGRINKWRTLLPQAELVVRPFESAQWPGGDLLQDFCQILGWPDLTQLSGAQVTQHSNRSLGSGMLSLAREVNRLVNDGRALENRLGFAALHHALDRRGLLGAGRARKVDLFSPRHRRELRQRYQPVFEELGVRFLADLPQGDEEGLMDLPQFADLPPDRQIDLQGLALKAAVLAIDDLQAAYWHHQRLVAEPEEELKRLEKHTADLKAREKDARRQLRSLQVENKALGRRHRELERQFAKTLRSRWLRFKAWWRARRGRSLENNAG